MGKGRRKPKKTKQGGQPHPQRQTARRADPGVTDDQTPGWGFRRAEREGPWAIGEDFLEKVMPKLAGYEGQTWSKIKQAAGGRTTGTNNHSLNIGRDLSDEASKRAATLKLDEESDLFSLRLGGQERIIGVRDGRVLEILWHDREHEVAKSAKR